MVQSSARHMAVWLVIIITELLFYCYLFGDLTLWGRQASFIFIEWACVQSLLDTMSSVTLGTREELNGLSEPRGSWQVREADISTRKASSG